MSSSSIPGGCPLILFFWARGTDFVDVGGYAYMGSTASKGFVDDRIKGSFHSTDLKCYSGIPTFDQTQCHGTPRSPPFPPASFSLVVPVHPLA